MIAATQLPDGRLRVPFSVTLVGAVADGFKVIGPDDPEFEAWQHTLQEHVFEPLLHLRNRKGEWIDMPDHEHAPRASDRFAAVVHDFEAGGLRSRVLRTEEWKPAGGMVHFTVRDGDHVVGTGEFSFQGDQAHMDRLFIEPEHQGRGFASPFFKHVLDGLREMGISKVTIQATQVGGYAWARAGFVWQRNSTSEAHRILSEAVKAGRWYEMRDKVPKETLDAFAEKVKQGGFGSEAEMAAFGREHTWEEGGQTWWVGKKVLVGARWKGERAP